MLLILLTTNLLRSGMALADYDSRGSLDSYGLWGDNDEDNGA